MERAAGFGIETGKRVANVDPQAVMSSLTANSEERTVDPFIGTARQSNAFNALAKVEFEAVAINKKAT